MGDWYVIASIPTFFEDGVHNARDTCELMPDGTIDAVYVARVMQVMTCLRTSREFGSAAIARQDC